MKNFCNYYIGAWILYYLQGTLYESGNRLSQGLMLLLMIVSLYYFVYANQHYKLPKAMKVLSALIVLFTIYGAFIILFGNGVAYVENYQYLKAIYMSLLPVFPFYVFTRKGQLTDKRLCLWVFMFIPVAIACLYRDQREALERAMELHSDRQEFTLNTGYLFLAIITLLPLFKKAFLQYALLAVCLAFVLMGMKRGAILIGGICMLYYILSAFNSTSRNKKFWIVLLSVAILVAGYYAVQYMLDTSMYFNARIEQTREGDASGRNELFGTYINTFFNFGLLSFLFGHGADATLRMIGYAHNDWLEIAINNGLIGLSLYMYYWLVMYKTFRNTNDAALKKMIGLFVIVYFSRTFFSMSYNDIPIYATAALGYALAERDLMRIKTEANR